MANRPSVTKNPDRITYVDVTQLVHWTGRVTGIPRVMYELAIRFAEQPGIHFVAWVKERKEMCELDFKKTLAAKGGGIAYLHATQSSERPMLQTASLLKYRAKRVIKAVGRRILRRVNVGLAATIEDSLRQHNFANLRAAAFKAGDVVLIPWGEWWDQNFTDYVVAQEEAEVRVVQIIHDIGPTVQPQFFEQVGVRPEAYNAAVLPNAALVIVVSENTKRELADWLRSQKLRVPHIEFAREGDDINASNARYPSEPQFAAAGLKGGDFLLTVGTIEAKKNHTLLYYVRKLAKSRGVVLPKMVILGRRGWLTDDIYQLMTHDPEVKDDFVFLHNASDEELAWAYDHCLFTVQPAFHEGWGIPVAESVARGVPSLCSNASSMVEIAEGIVEHFSPASSDECLAAIQNWLDPRKLADIRKRTKAYKPTSWDDMFHTVDQYMKEIT